MGFESVRFWNFRNLKDRELALGAREVFLIGENGQGKTNLIEALYLLSVASSFREKREAAFFRDQDSEIGLFARYHDVDGGDKTLSLRIEKGKKKEIGINGKSVTERRDLLGQILSICFVQQDMELIAGSPEEKRRFFDQTLIFSDLTYIEILRNYRRVLRARNFILKQGQEELLDTYDAQIAPLGMEVTRRRTVLIREFNTLFSALFREITGMDQSVEILHVPSWQMDESSSDVSERLAKLRGRDLAFGTTTSGPHRDIISFSHDGKDYSTHASTGQIRLCALILRTAQARFLAERTGRKPVLLLDDVLLELDPNKKRAFISRFPPYEQAFFTFLPDENYLPYRNESTLLLSVEKGDFRPW